MVIILYLIFLFSKIIFSYTDSLKKLLYYLTFTVILMVLPFTLKV